MLWVSFSGRAVKAAREMLYRMQQVLHAKC